MTILQDRETPPNDWEDLIERAAITTQGELDIAEAKNIALPTQKYLSARPSLRSAPFTDTWMRKLHREMFCDVWKWAGELRLKDVNIGNVPFYQVATQLYELAETVKFWRTSKAMSIVEQGVRLHHRAVVIHPFPNGNGRWARLLSNILLRQAGWGYVAWPDSAILQQNSSIRRKYINALQAADGGCLSALQELHEEYLVA